LIRVNPSLANIITAKADAYVSALDSCFNTIGPVSAVAKAVLDVRTAPNFLAALTAAGVANIPALINLALLVNLSIMLNQVFQQVLGGLVPALAAVLATVLVTVNSVLIALSALLGNVLATVVGLLGGVLNTVAGLLNGLVFPTVFQITGVLFPTLNQLLSQSLLNQLVPLPGNLIPIPSSALAPAATLFNLLNCAH
jgi:phage-related protein